MKAVVLFDPPAPPPPNDVVNTGPLGGKQCRLPQLNDHKHNKLVVTVYTGITIQTLVLYYVVKCAGFTHAHRCIHKHTQILHSADRIRQLPTLRRVSSLNNAPWILVIHNSSRTTHECVYHLLLIQGHPLCLVRQGLEQGMGALTGCECDSHCEGESPHPGMWEGELSSKGNPLM